MLGFQEKLQQLIVGGIGPAHHEHTTFDPRPFHLEGVEKCLEPKHVASTRTMTELVSKHFLHDRGKRFFHIKMVFLRMIQGRALFREKDDMIKDRFDQQAQIFLKFQIRQKRNAVYFFKFLCDLYDNLFLVFKSGPVRGLKRAFGYELHRDLVALVRVFRNAERVFQIIVYLVSGIRVTVGDPDHLLAGAFHPAAGTDPAEHRG